MPLRPILVKPRFAKYTGLTIPIQRSRKFKMAEICTAIQLYRMQFHYQNNLETFYRGFEQMPTPTSATQFDLTVFFGPEWHSTLPKET